MLLVYYCTFGTNKDNNNICFLQLDVSQARHLSQHYIYLQTVTRDRSISVCDFLIGQVALWPVCCSGH